VPNGLSALFDCTGFDWDEANAGKNWLRHKVARGECEEVFFNAPLLVAFDEGHSSVESRFYALGQTDAARGLFVVFTVRGSLVRVISARDMSHKERKEYQRAQTDETPPNP